MPHSSLRPKKSEAPRCGQCASTTPTCPSLSLKATRSSPSRRSRAGGQSGSGISPGSSAGSQKRRNSSPMGVPGPTRHRRSMDGILNVNWERMFGLDTPLLEIFLRGTIMYLGLFLMLRVIRRREAAELGVTDLLVVVLLADAAQNAMAGEYTSITDGIL